MSKETSLLVDLIRQSIEARMVETHTSIPGIIVSFDASKQTCSVQPAVKRKFSDGSIVNLPVIPNVPVCFPSGNGGKSFLSFPLKRNDPVLIIFSERSIDVFMEKGGVVDPLDPRKFNFSDAIVIPGLFTKPIKSSRVSPQHTRLESGDASVELQDNGKFKIGKVGGDELFDLLSQVADACSQISNSSGPTFNAGTFVSLKAKIDALKG